MGQLSCCFGEDQEDSTPDPEERRQRMLEAAERREAESKARGVKNPENIERKKKRQEELEKAQKSSSPDSGNVLKWNVFTINSESKFIIVSNVNATGLANDLLKAFSKYGTVVQCDEILDYPKEEFTQMFLLKFEDIQSARKAKKNGDEVYFFGSTLHVSYAPEYETVEDTREKLIHRRASVIQRTKFLAREQKRASKSASSSDNVDTAGSSKTVPSGSCLDTTKIGTRAEPPPTRTQTQIRDYSASHSRPSGRKRQRTNENMENSVVKNPVASRAGVKDWQPPKKTPKLVRLPGYIPPKSVSLPP